MSTENRDLDRGNGASGESQPTGPTARRTLFERLRRGAEAIAALMLAIMFLAFVAQIAFRYLFNWPLGWTSELSLIAWLWLVLWGAAFVLRERDEIRFDIISAGAGRRARRVMGLIGAVGLLVLYGASVPATWDYVTFMKVEQTSYLDIRFDWLYSIYLIFLAAVIVRYLWLAWRALTGRDALDDSRGSASGI